LQIRDEVPRPTCIGSSALGQESEEVLPGNEVEERVRNGKFGFLKLSTRSAQPAAVYDEYLRKHALANRSLERLGVRLTAIAGRHHTTMLKVKLITQRGLRIPDCRDAVVATGSILGLHDDQDVPHTQHDIGLREREPRPEPTGV
jgi:hypothetical protein